MSAVPSGSPDLMISGRAASHSGPTETFTSDLARLCFRDPVEDADRPLAWANAVCAFFLVIGLFGLKPPELRIPAPVNATYLPPTPVRFDPPPQTDLDQSTAADSAANVQPSASTPVVPPLFRVLLPDKVEGFQLPVAGDVEIVQVPKDATPPPRELPKPVPPVVGNPGPSPSTAPKAAAGSPGPKVFRPTSDGGSYPRITYPREAELAHQHGTVTIVWVVDPNGTVVSTEIKQTSGYARLDRHAAEWIKKRWRFPPGDTRSFVMDVVFEF